LVCRYRNLLCSAATGSQTHATRDDKRRHKKAWITLSPFRFCHLTLFGSEKRTSWPLIVKGIACEHPPQVNLW
jgi:hypothetical protein